MDFSEIYNEVEEFVDGIVHEKLFSELEDGEYTADYIKYNIPEYNTNWAAPEFDGYDSTDPELNRLYENAVNAVKAWVMAGLFNTNN